MRFAAPFLIALFLAAPLATPAGAAPLSATSMQAPSNPSIVNVADGCGRGFHRTRSHRNRYGHWVRGRCVRNYRR
jgi:hypothetical protein